MKLVKLDAESVAGFKLPDGKKDVIHFDSELRGFGFRLRQRDGGRLRRSWIVQYFTGGRTRRIKLGSAETLTASEARAAARRLLARIELGDDPQAERQAKRAQAANAFGAVVGAYLEAKQPELRPVSFRIAKLYLAGSYFNSLQPMDIAAVKRSDVAAAIRTILRKHSTSTAAAARRQLSAFFAWCIAEGLLGDGANPVDGSHRPADPKPRERVLDDSELVAIWHACAGDDDFATIVKLLVLTGCRRQEIGGLSWSELNPDGNWTLPAERAKNGREHSLVLPPAALAIIRAVPRRSRDHLFGDRAGDGFTSWSRGKQDLDRRLGGSVRAWRVHDIRRSVATGMADIGIEPHIIEATLNHYSGHRRGIAGVYNRSRYERAVKAALARWSEHLEGLVEGRNLRRAA
jgi:integrase